MTTTADTKRAAAVKKAVLNKLNSLEAEHKRAAKRTNAEKAAAEKKASAERAKAMVIEDRNKAYDELRPIAKEIVERIEIAAKNEDQAWDHRLAASLRLAEAKAKCETAGIKFKLWVETNIPKHSFETIRKLASAGVGGEKKAALALADMRSKNALANREHRAKQKAKSVSRDTRGQEPKEKKVNPAVVAEQALAALPDKQRLAVATIPVEKLGMRIVSEADAKALRGYREAENAGKVPVLVSIEPMKVAFASLKATAKKTFVEWAAAEIGYKLTSDFDVPAGDPMAIPAALRRKAPDANKVAA